MELSLFSRDVIALATAVALSHDVFDAALLLGVCDKIVPGLLIGALQFGHLPVVFVPAGPMTSGLPNNEKAKVRQRFAEGKATRRSCSPPRRRAYHGEGTCTFYGTANSNQMLMEVMGLHLPGASFVNPGTPLRDALTDFAVAARAARSPRRAADAAADRPRSSTRRRSSTRIVGLLATGGSTNHTMHLVAMARAAGIRIDWDDFAELSRGRAAAGAHLSQRQGRREPLPRRRRHGLPDPRTARRRPAARGRPHRARPRPAALCASSRGSTTASCAWREAPRAVGATTTCCAGRRAVQRRRRPARARGNLGRAVIKVSAVAPQHRRVEAPARVFDSQEALVGFKPGR